MSKKKSPEQPSIQWTQSPEYEQQMALFKGIQEPWMQSQFGLYEDIFEPQMRELGGFLGEQLRDPYTDLMKQMQTRLGEQLEQPLSLPQDVWANMWQQAQERTGAQYGKARQTATERAAASGMLGQGATERYFQSLDIGQAKSTEDIAVDMVIKEWEEKKFAQQQAFENVQAFLPSEMRARQQPIANLMAFQTLQPQFNIPMPTSMPYAVPGEEGQSFMEQYTLGGMMGMSDEQQMQAMMMALMAASDIRLKTNIKKIGKTKSGLNIYKWDWKKWTKKIVGNTLTIGVIAQEVMKIIPKAVSRGKHGYLMVDYNMI